MRPRAFTVSPEGLSCFLIRRSCTATESECDPGLGRAGAASFPNRRARADSTRRNPYLYEHAPISRQGLHARIGGLARSSTTAAWEVARSFLVSRIADVLARYIATTIIRPGPCAVERPWLRCLYLDLWPQSRGHWGREPDLRRANQNLEAHRVSCGPFNLPSCRVSAAPPTCKPSPRSSTCVAPGVSRPPLYWEGVSAFGLKWDMGLEMSRHGCRNLRGHDSHPTRRYQNN